MDSLLIVEDEVSIRETLTDFFLSREYLVFQAGSVAESRRILEVQRPSLILLDLSLPDGDGIEVVRLVRGRGDNTPIIILTARGAEEWRVRGLESGADDYVVKPFSVHELAARIRAVMRRSDALPVRLTLGHAAIDFAASCVTRGGETHHLTQKESDLLAFFLRHPERVFRREDLLKAVWGFSESPTTRTVDTHVFNLRRKIEEDPEHPRFFHTQHGVGYRFQP